MTSTVKLRFKLEFSMTKPEPHTTEGQKEFLKEKNVCFSTEKLVTLVTRKFSDFGNYHDDYYGDAGWLS